MHPYYSAPESNWQLAFCPQTARGDKPKFFVKLLYTKVCEGLGRAAPTYQNNLYKTDRGSKAVSMLSHVSALTFSLLKEKVSQKKSVRVVGFVQTCKPRSRAGRFAR